MGFRKNISGNMFPPRRVETYFRKQKNARWACVPIQRKGEGTPSLAAAHSREGEERKKEAERGTPFRFPTREIARRGWLRLFRFPSAVILVPLRSLRRIGVPVTQNHPPAAGSPAPIRRNRRSLADWAWGSSTTARSFSRFFEGGLLLKCGPKSVLFILVQMDSYASALAFKGSVAEAIAEAKAKNEILLVYVSGTNEDSVLLEKSTWVDPNVARGSTETLCRSLDSIHFSACYPIKAVPSISAVGYNGVLLWQSEGDINPEKLLAGIQKAWSDLHSQEAAAAVLTAALESNKSEDPSSSTSNDSELLKASSEIAEVPSLFRCATK